MADRLNPYQGPSGRTGNPTPAWSINNFARWFRPSLFETAAPGAAAAAAPSVGGSSLRPGGQFGFEGQGTINRDENFNLNAPGGGVAAGEEGGATGSGPITADTGARAATQPAFQAMANPFGFVTNNSFGRVGNNLGNAAINLAASLNPVTAALNMGRNLAVNLGRFGDMVANMAFGQPGTGSNPGMAFGAPGSPASQVSGGELGMSFDAPATNFAGRTGDPSETGATGFSSTGVPFGGPGRSPDLTTPFAQQQNLPGFRPTVPTVTPNAPDATAPTNTDEGVGTGQPGNPGAGMGTGQPGGQVSGGEISVGTETGTTGTGTSGTSGVGPGSSSSGTAGAADNGGEGGPGGTGAGDGPSGAAGDLHRGGPVVGPSHPPDSVPARLTGGEFVLNPYATSVFRPALEIFNRAVTAEGINPRIMAMLGIGAERGEDPSAPRGAGYQEGGYVDPWVAASRSSRVDPRYMSRVRSGAVTPLQDFAGFVSDATGLRNPYGNTRSVPSPRGRGRAAEGPDQAAGSR